MRAPYIGRMADDITKLSLLKIKALEAQDAFFAHRDPGNLTPAQKQAFQYRDMAHLLLFKAAQMELDAETELQALLNMEPA